MQASFHANALKCHTLALKIHFHAFTYVYIIFLYECVTLKGQSSVKQNNLWFLGVRTFSKPLRNMSPFTGHKPNNNNLTFYNSLRRRLCCVAVYIQCEGLVSLSRDHNLYIYIKMLIIKQKITPTTVFLTTRWC